MGLDYGISVKIKRRKTKEIIDTVEIAYWRKCWALRTKTMQIAMSNEENVISYHEDWLLEVKPKILKDIIETLSTAVANRNDEMFTDSIWGAYSARQTTISQLSNLCVWDSLFAHFDDILTYKDIEDRERYLNCEIIADVIRDIEYDNNYRNIKFNLHDVLMNLEEYEFSIEILNSY